MPVRPPQSGLPGPRRVDLWRFRAALDARGLRERVQTLVDDPETSQAVKIFWEYGNQIDQHNRGLSVFASKLGLTDRDIEDLFREASLIQLD